MVAGPSLLILHPHGGNRRDDITAPDESCARFMRRGRAFVAEGCVLASAAKEHELGDIARELGLSATSEEIGDVVREVNEQLAGEMSMKDLDSVSGGLQDPLQTATRSLQTLANALSTSRDVALNVIGNMSA